MKSRTLEHSFNGLKLPLYEQEDPRSQGMLATIQFRIFSLPVSCLKTYILKYTEP